MAANLVPARLTKSLPSAPRAKLPVAYENAKTALATCDKVDECKDWSDKALALASYARQARDEMLLMTAIRIQTRAITRAGELLDEIAPKRGANQNFKVGGDPKVGRTQAATDAGLSERQRKQSLRVAGVKRSDPEAFEEMLESECPLTPAQILRNENAFANHRTPDHTGTEFQAATAYLGMLSELKEMFAEVLPPDNVVRGMHNEHELARAARGTADAIQNLKLMQRSLQWELKQVSGARSKPRTKK